MTEDDIIHLGTWCENLLTSDTFSTVCQEYEKQCFGHWLSTDVKNLKEREAIFTKARALQDFLGHMGAYVAQMNEVIKRNEALSDADAQYGELD